MDLESRDRASLCMELHLEKIFKHTRRLSSGSNAIAPILESTEKFLAFLCIHSIFLPQPFVVI